MRRRAPSSRCLRALPVLPALSLLLLGLPAAAGDLSPARQAMLDNLLLQDCGSCHGLTMKGGLGPPLLPQRMAGFADEQLIEVILEGRPGTPMPPWRPELSRADAAWLVQRLKEGTEQ